ncbi:kappa-type opioid receptor-like [Asterias rubens]|uniref:kappa-type opioid receptor-like n=1 Tax=Asterias rubens TaxID=7604 RepID=UPI0014555D1F|nr:kappa-type opioid receptor-like [Asterias rubens]
MADNSSLDECLADAKNISLLNISLWLYSPKDIIVITIVIPIILCLGVINNSAFLFVMFRVPTMRSATNICLAHLAVADLLYLTVTSIVFIILTYATSPSVANNVILSSSAKCFTFGSLRLTGYFVSIALLTTVSLERYLAVCHPGKHLKIRGRRRTNTMVAICWVVGLMFACSLTLSTSAVMKTRCFIWPEVYRNFPTLFSYCGPVVDVAGIFGPPLSLVAWFTTMIANVFMYIRIIYALNKRRSATFMKGNDHQAKQSRNKVAQLLIVNGVVFFTCQTPSIVDHLVNYYHMIIPTYGSNETYSQLAVNKAWFAEIPLLINTIVNPLIYGAIHAQYRSAFIQAFRCNTGSSRLQFDKANPAVSLQAMKRARNFTDDETNDTMLVKSNITRL